MHQNTLWATWMQKRYRNNKLFWMVSYDNNSSFIQKLLLKTRDDNKHSTQRQIVNGRDTSLCFDPWIDGNTLPGTLGWSYMAHYNTHNHKVSKVIRNTDLDFNAVELPGNIGNAIKRVKKQSYGENDYWEQAPNKGKFSPKSAWSSTRIEGDHLSQCNKLWNNCCAPRCPLQHILQN